jgi:hypothetical protein
MNKKLFKLHEYLGKHIFRARYKKDILRVCECGRCIWNNDDGHTDLTFIYHMNPIMWDKEYKNPMVLKAMITNGKLIGKPVKHLEKLLDGS